MQIAVRPLREHDLREADRIFRLGFGTFVGMADLTTRRRSDWIATRRRTT
jgi:hypothetical protein